MNDGWTRPRSVVSTLAMIVVAVSILTVLQLSGDGRADAAPVRTVLVAANSGKCLSVYPGDTGNGAIAYQWTCGAGNNIEVEDAGGGWHYVKFVHSGKCLTVNGFADWDGAILDQWNCSGQSNQMWSGHFVGGVFEVHFSAANPTKCLTVSAESTANGAWVNQWQCVYQANQSWIMRDADPTPTPTRTPTRVPTTTATVTRTPMPTMTVAATCGAEAGLVSAIVGC